MYLYYTHIDSTNLITKPLKNNKKMICDYYYPKAPNKKLLSIGSSMQQGLFEFLPYNFRYSKQIRMNGSKYKKQWRLMKDYKIDIEKYEPDILLLVVTTNNLYYFDQLFEE